MKKIYDPPEVADLVNMCEMLPKTKMTREICDKVNNEKNLISHPKKSRKKK